MDCLKLYCCITKIFGNQVEFVALPNQGEFTALSNNLYTRTFLYDKGSVFEMLGDFTNSEIKKYSPAAVFATIKPITDEYLTKEKNSFLFLVDINIPNLEIINFNEIFWSRYKPLPEYEKHKEVKEHNIKILQNFLKKNKKSTKTFNYPDIPEGVFLEKTKWQTLYSTVELGLIPLMLGPKGCGKTTIVKALAKARGAKFYRVDCGTLSKPKSSLVGQLHAKDGNTIILESEFLKYYKSSDEQEVIIFLDEISRVPSQAANYLITILEDDSYIYVEELGECIYKGKNVKFITAGNFGMEYTDTRILDGALLDRFIKNFFYYLDKADELKLLKYKLNNKIDELELEILIDLANVLREQYADKNLSIDISTRKLVQFSQFFLHGFSSREIVLQFFRPLYITDNENDLELFDKLTDAYNII